ncbi:glycoside hydrolase family 3 C-terminal domain-containing protein [Mangrovibacterium lignilyticum]|uniref:glycoside hydrolase family 3 C-terminal domain-containing protein n=1 Tax=Mangrovibacterium lignilyticum TaxID=2668052 RepID=UPI0013CFAB1C|nr:glycoside hydrolase family 3 C-terminal domain-containing protein [Mangrovibacterium lignilyticum]
MYTEFVSDVIAQVEAGNDLMMPGTEEQKKVLTQAIVDGKIDPEAVNSSLRRILEYIAATSTVQKYEYSNKPDLKGHAEVTRSAATEGMVLLKNDAAVLPYKTKTGSVAVFGGTSYSFIAGGTGSGDVNEAYTVSLIEGLENAGYKIDKELQGKYVPFVKEAEAKEMQRRKEHGGLLSDVQRLPEMPLSQDLVAKKAESSDVAIITIGRNAGEQHDRKINNDFYLGLDEVKMINTVSDAFHAVGKRVIVILNIGGVIETASWKDKVDAILVAWQPGQEGGNSVADVFSGKANPSGKLTMTFPVDYNNIPSAADFPGVPANDPKEVFYKEGIYIGYRYFNTFKVQPSYEFGYGSSYTTFDYSDLKLSTTNFKDELEVSVTVTNTGKVAGKEVVQLYVSAPAKIVDKPSEELKAFAKTKVLDPGQSQTLKFTLNASDLASFIDDESAWIAEKGAYKVKVGASSLDIKLKEDFSLDKDITTEKVHNTFDLDVDMDDVLENN